MIQDGFYAYWQLTGSYGITNAVVPPSYIVATYDEANKTFRIYDSKRFEVITDDAKEDLQALYKHMEQEGIDQLRPLVVRQKVMVIPHKSKSFTQTSP